MYKERIAYHESVDEEHKKNLEQQVDVILKMEEERLVLLREHKASKEKFEELEQERVQWQCEKTDLTGRNQQLDAKVALFTKELSGLRDEVQQSKEQMQREQERAALAIEKANRRRPAVGGLKSATAGTTGPAKKSLKFTKPAEASGANNSAQSESALCPGCKLNNSKTYQMLIKQDPANRSLLSDN